VVGGKIKEGDPTLKFVDSVANSTVTIRVVDDMVNTKTYQQSATSDGHLNAHLGISCNSGGSLHFSATDGTADPHDLTGVLWSNTFTTPCP
jgi:hypothetical protein